MRVTWLTHLILFYLFTLIVLVWRKNVIILCLYPPPPPPRPKLQFPCKPVLKYFFSVSCSAVWRRVVWWIVTEVLEEALSVFFRGSENSKVGSLGSHTLKTVAGGYSETTKLYCVIFEKAIMLIYTEISRMFCGLHKNKQTCVGLKASNTCTNCSRRTCTMQPDTYVYRPVFIYMN